MGEIGPEKILLLLLIVLLLFGAKRLPEIGQSLGKGIREFKRSVSDIGPAPPVDRAPDLRRESPEREAERGKEPKRLLGDGSDE
jgi:sec-independent protein translocase protein TatA